ncbi:hypothetical protein C8Q79DRAFT_1011061 [Trametes meyenii]|nr:hypothetical protein C8Q79DRAFT_1011061 [Trametes meyenii]
MPPHRKPRRFLTTASFYDSAGAIADGSPQPSPTASSFFWDGPGSSSGMNVDRGADSDDEYTLTGYGELSSEAAFMLPPSPTQTIKYRYRAYRPKLARLRKLRSSASKAPLKAKSGAARVSDYSAILSAYLSGGASSRSPKRDFQVLLQKYRDSGDAWRDRDNEPYVTPRKALVDRAARRTGSASVLAATAAR